jgi:hypothetical protein
MTIHELTERDFHRAKINLEKAKKKPNVPQSELEHLAELCVLRQHIFELCILKGEET